MDARHLVNASNETDADVDMEMLERTALRTLERELDETAEMSLVIIDDGQIQQLNRDWRGYDEPTDVLSFGLSERSKPAAEGEMFFPFPQFGDNVLHLGEVFISLPTTARQAQEMGLPIELELRHLLIHGILHLLGHDHAEPEEAARMQERERILLAETQT